MPVLGGSTQITIDKILFATDFSDVSRIALQHAKAFGHHFESSVRAIHVLSRIGATSPESTWLVQRMWREVQQGLAEVNDELHQAGLDATTALLEGGDPGQRILDVAKEMEPDLIVMGTTAATDLDRFLLGSTAEQVIRKTARPVLTTGPSVKTPTGNLSFQRIVYATDFSPQAAQAALYALSLAATEGAHISLCHVLPEGKLAGQDGARLNHIFMHALEKLIPPEVRDWCTPELVVQTGDAEEEILNLAESREADLIILGARPASRIFTHFKPGIAYRVIAGAKCPVITIRGTKR